MPGEAGTIVQRASNQPYRAVIFNADDFGLSPGVNEGIVRAHRHGIVRAASLMVAAPAFAEAVSCARAHPELDLGIHLTLTAGCPVLQPSQVPSLVTRTGHFPRFGHWLLRALCGRIDPEDIRREFVAQVERALATGLRFTHLDSHHHVHLFPTVQPVVTDIARQFGLPFVRSIAHHHGKAGYNGVTAVKHRILRCLQRPNPTTSRNERAVRALLIPAPGSPARWRQFLQALPEGVTELVCHPGLADRVLAQLDPYTVEREVELRWLTSRQLASLVAEANVDVTSFSALADRGGR